MVVQGKRKEHNDPLWGPDSFQSVGWESCDSEGVEVKKFSVPGHWGQGGGAPKKFENRKFAQLFLP